MARTGRPLSEACRRGHPYTPDNIYQSARRKDERRRRWCRACALRRRSARERDAAKWTRERARERKLILIAEMGGRCTDCGWAGHPVTLEFDHVRGEKKHNVAALLLAAPMARVREEADKCELVCANCHAIRTYVRREERRSARLADGLDAAGRYGGPGADTPNAVKEIVPCRI